MAAGVKPKRKAQLTGVGLFAVMGKCLIVSSGVLLLDFYGVGLCCWGSE